MDLNLPAVLKVHRNKNIRKTKFGIYKFLRILLAALLVFTQFNFFAAPFTRSETSKGIAKADENPAAPAEQATSSQPNLLDFLNNTQPQVDGTSTDSFSGSSTQTSALAPETATSTATPDVATTTADIATATPATTTPNLETAPLATTTPNTASGTNNTQINPDELTAPESDEAKETASASTTASSFAAQASIDINEQNEQALEKTPEQYQHAELSNDSVNLSAPEKPQSDPFAVSSKALSALPLKFMPLNLSANVSLEQKDNLLIFHDAFKSTNLEYSLNSAGLKENIILNGGSHPENFSYLLNLGDYDFRQITDREIAIYKKNKNFNPLFKLFSITAPVMTDAGGQSSTALKFEITGNVLTLTPDADWLANAAYPVTIDPNVEISVLNVHSHPLEGENWNIDFVTDGTADLHIVPDDEATINDMQFSKLTCGAEDLTAGAQILANNEIFYPNWSCGDVATASFLDLKTGNHHLTFQFGSLGNESVSEAFNSTKVWTGGGGNANWSTAANWAGGTLPTSSDVVVFDTSCSSNCNPLLDQQAFIAGIIFATNTTSTLTPSTTASSSLTVYGDFVQNGGTFGASGSKHQMVEMDVSGNFTLSGGTFYSPDILRLNGNFTDSGGTFLNNFVVGNSKDHVTTPSYVGEYYPSLILDGGSQTISGNTTFGNLIKTAVATSTLTFEAGSTQTVLNNFELKGLKNSHLLLRSSQPGTKWNVSPAVSQNLDSLDVQDSNNTTAMTLCAHGGNFINSGNNTGWEFGAGLASCQPDPNFPITDGILYHTAKNSTSLYIQGEFSYVGPNNGMAVPLDKTTFSPTGTFPKIGNGQTNVIINDDAGGWYIGGDFTKVDGQYLAGLIHVFSNGQLDSNFQPQMTLGARVFTLLLNGSTLYVGGKFSKIGGAQRYDLAEIDAATGAATSWNPNPDNRDTGNDDYNNSYLGAVYSITLSGSYLYAVGDFAHLGGADHSAIVAIDTTTGIALPWSNFTGGPVFYSVVANNSVIYTAGMSGVQCFNGTTGVEYLSSGQACAGNMTSRLSGKLLKYGNTLYYGWNHSSSFDGGVMAFDVSSSTKPSALSWTPITDKIQIYDMELDGTNLYLAGDFWPASAPYGYDTFEIRSNIKVLDLSSGTGTLTDSRYLTSGAIGSLAINSGIIYAGILGETKGGSGISSIGGVNRNGLAAIDLTTKQVTGWNPWPNPCNGCWYTIHSMAADDNYVYMGGENIGDTIGGAYRQGFVVISTATGLAVDDYPDMNETAWGQVWSIRLSGDYVYVSGYINDVGGVPVNNIAKLKKPNAPLYAACDVDGSILNESFESGTLPDGWFSGGDAAWTATTSTSSAGTYSLTSGTITNSQTSIASTTINLSAPARLGFNYNVSSESGYDFLLFCIDNEGCDNTNAAFSASGQSGWLTALVDIPAGTHTLIWKYTKDSSGASGQDRVWIDNIKLGNYSSVPCENMSSKYVVAWAAPYFDDAVYDTWPDPTRNLVYITGDFTKAYGSPEDYVAALDMTTGKAAPWQLNFSFDNFDGYYARFAKVGNVLYLTSDESTQTGSQIAAFSIDADSGNLNAWNPQFDSTVSAMTDLVRADANKVLVGGGFAGVGGLERWGFAALNPKDATANGFAPDVDDNNHWPSWEELYYPEVYSIEMDGNSIYLAGDFGSMNGQVDTLYGTGGTGQYDLAAFQGPVRPQPAIGFETSASSVNKSSGTANVVVGLSATTTIDTGVEYVISDGSGTQGQDYVWSMGMAGIDAGKSTTTISVPLITTAPSGPTKTFQITLLSPDGAVLGANTINTVSILDDSSSSPATSGATFTEAGNSLDVVNPGTTASYNVALNTQPTSDVDISISTTGQATTSPAALIFTPSNWNTPQSVTVSALLSAKGNSTASIGHAFTSADAGYNGLVVANLSVNVTGPSEESSSGSSGGGTWYAQNFSLSINNFSTSTDNNLITVALSYDSSAKKIKLSNLPDFSTSSEFAVAGNTLNWDLCSGLPSCENGRHNVYARFYNDALALLGAASGDIDYQAKPAAHDASTPDAAAANDPVWQPDYRENKALENETLAEMCTISNNKPGWFGEYFDIPNSSPDVELPYGLWKKAYGDPLSKAKPWQADWYDSKNFRFAKTSSNLQFGSHYFPFDYVPQEFTSGHKYYFGASWSSTVIALNGNYAYRLSSDDDSWLYMDGQLIVDNSGIHGAASKTGILKLSGKHFIQIFFAERHTTDSHMYFIIDDPLGQISYNAYYPACESLQTELPKQEPAPAPEQSLPKNSDLSQTTSSASGTPAVSENSQTPAGTNSGSGYGALPSGAQNSYDTSTAGQLSGQISTQLAYLVMAPISAVLDAATNVASGIGEATQNLAVAAFTSLKAGPAVQKTVLTLTAVTVVPLAALASQGVAPGVALTALTSFSELQLWLLKLLQWLASLLGLRRKKRYWGTVYDSVTKQPLDPVIVELHDAQTGQKIEQTITDMAGRFGFLAKQGTFIITAVKTHYAFPSKKITGQTDQIFDNLYYGAALTISSNDVIAPNIPMDPLGFDWNQMDKKRIIKFHPLKDSLTKLVFDSLFALGFVWSILTASLQPSPWNLTVVACYVLIMLIQFIWPKQHLWGRLYSRSTMQCLGGMLLELNHPNLPVVIGKAKTGPDGKFFLKANPGNYVLNISELDAEQKIKLRALPVTVGQTGLINNNIGL